MGTKRDKRDYTPEFKVQAARLVLNEKMSIGRAAEDLGISMSTLNGWLKKFESGKWDLATGLSVGDRRRIDPKTSSLSSSLSADKIRIQELEKQNRRLTLERDILKKAMAYCVDVPR